MATSIKKDEMMKDASLYTILIDGFSKCGNLDMAIDLFDELLLKGLKPHMKTYTVVLRVLFREGLSGKAKELLQNMEENGCLPNSFTYNVIVRELLKKNECREAEIYLEEMINRGFVPDYATFSMLLPLIPNEGQDSRLRNIIQKVKDVERKDAGIRELTSRIIS
ncbi:putative tetratricopeptide-like helical domain superfamily protein [Tanacetum coccineum]|uniref:Tetratricopeptide-like helical domain superfamily protein n=1 Tax=Tanacetum coccineum TaxID=301880 RepID=A0ABQ4XHE9_9ASTR